jgi:NADPH:quinone reductase-like Zn-dependent oxidoreductase
MRAASFSQFGGPEVLEIVDLQEPHAGPGQIRTAVYAAGINATDWKVRQGRMGGDLPQTTGHDVASVVDEASEGGTAPVVIYTPSHADHFGGVKGVVSQDAEAASTRCASP